MTPAALILLMIAGWLCVAASMLWGMLRIARRHHPVVPLRPTAPVEGPARRGPLHQERRRAPRAPWTQVPLGHGAG
ncbi:MAG: hypothetical protein ABWY06_17440 [Pseudomonas sp.]|uniref:hypothetical protein n=1 Tax=Pseudomonas sp. TaxID=306 RepID=UPI003394DBAF